ncbi:phytoene desaturase [Candidatus Poribacteria bacterium]|nr:phytoene desaturase [Candidatus Poribacteria bacterium]
MDKIVAVIGGGLGALSGAIRLARLGFKVQLFEQNDKLGGKMNEIKLGPYRFDTGPSLLTMPFVVEDLFSFAGFECASWLEFAPLEPLCRYFFPDGSVIDASVDREKMLAAVAKFSPAEAEAYEKFLAYAAQIYHLTAEIFLFTPIHERQKLIRWRYLPLLFKLHKIDAFRTVHQGVARFFHDSRLIQLFDRYATYNGSNPFQAPATLNIIPYVEYGLGGYYIKGGMYRLIDALEKIARNLGVEIQTSVRVDKILWSNKRVRGIIVNGAMVLADYVLCGADVVVAYNALIDGLPAGRQKLNRLEASLSGMVFLWGVGKKYPQLHQHNIIFSADYQREFTQIFQECRAPDEPTIYIAITSKTDPEHAPLYGENWFVMLNMPYLAEGQRWEMEKGRMRSIVFKKLREIGIDLSRNIEAEAVYMPADFCQLYASNRGSIYGISSNNRSMAFKRPANRSRDIKGLYFAGGSVHPGGGIPLVLLSGKMAAELIAEAEGIKL